MLAPCDRPIRGVLSKFATRVNLRSSAEARQGPAAPNRLSCLQVAPYHGSVRVLPVLIFSLALLPAATAGAWDSGGHEIVATLAYQPLTPKARQAVDARAREVGPAYDAITVACWMDDIRADGAATPYRGLFK